LGYVYENQRELDSHYNSIITMNFNHFIEEVELILEENYPTRVIVFQTATNVIKSKKELVSDDTTTVQDVFMKIKNMLKKGQPCRRAIEPYLISLIECIKWSNILFIPSDKAILTKTIGPDIGKGMKRRGPTKKRKKKQNTKKRTKTNKFLRGKKQ
jgi:hypothetical protein